MRILLLASAFNGLTQRVWLELRRAGHDVTVELALGPDTMRQAVALADPDLIICPFLRERVPADIWSRRRTIIIHPGPVGDRGPSSLDWAISEGAPEWGVTALQAAEEMDAGDIWATRTFPIGPVPPRKSSLYNGPVTETAVQLVHEVVAKAGDPGFVPTPLDYSRPDVTGRLRPPMRQADRAFSWELPPEEALRRIRAADSAPGVRTELCGRPVHVFDAHLGELPSAGDPGTIAARRQGAVLVRTGDGGGIWVGHLRLASAGDPLGPPAGKLAATTVLGEPVAGVPVVAASTNPDAPTYREISYRRDGDVGVLTVDVYNGALSTAHCRRLASALRQAAAQRTKVLVVNGGEVFGNGIHLNVIDAADSPAAEGWRNIVAIDDACRQVITCTDQVVLAAIGGNAGAGGVMLGLGADRVLVRAGVVLNPHYATMGLSGSEYWTYTLPRRIGRAQAERLTQDCLPIGSVEAVALGLADAALPGDPVEFDAAVRDYAARLAARPHHEAVVERKRRRLAADQHHKPLDAYRAEELAEMSRDLFADRRGFEAARRAFVTKQRPAATPPRLARHRPTGASPVQPRPAGTARPIAGA